MDALNRLSYDFTVEFGPPIVEDIKFIFSSEENPPFLIAERRFDISVENYFFFSAGLCQNFAVRSNDKTMTQIARPALLPDPIRGYEKDAILGGPGPGNLIRVEGGGAGPGGGDQNDLSAHECERPTRLREAQIIADERSYPADWGL